MKKYVVSQSVTSPEWKNSIAVKGDIAAEIRKLKQENGSDLHVHGCGALVNTLMHHDLVDAY